MQALHWHIISYLPLPAEFWPIFGFLDTSRLLTISPSKNERQNTKEIAFWKNAKKALCIVAAAVGAKLQPMFKWLFIEWYLILSLILSRCWLWCRAMVEFMGELYKILIRSYHVSRQLWCRIRSANKIKSNTNWRSTLNKSMVPWWTLVWTPLINLGTKPKKLWSSLKSVQESTMHRKSPVYVSVFKKLSAHQRHKWRSLLDSPPLFCCPKSWLKWMPPIIQWLAYTSNQGSGMPICPLKNLDNINWHCHSSWLIYDWSNEPMFPSLASEVPSRCLAPSLKFENAELHV